MHFLFTLTGKGLTLLACLLMAGTLQAQCINNLVSNGDMDTNVDANSPNLPDGYFAYSDGTLTESIVTSPFDGSSAASVSVSGGTFGGYASLLPLVVPGAEYNWNADVQVLTGAANLVISWRDANGVEVDRSLSDTITPADDLATLSLIATAPTGLDVTQAQIAVNFSNSSVVVDNFCFTEPTCGNNLYSNGSFEDPNSPGSFFPLMSGSQSVVEDGTTGRYALSVGAGTGGGFRLIMPGPNTFEPGDQVALSARAKSSNGGLTIVFNFSAGTDRAFHATSLATDPNNFSEIRSALITVPDSVRNITIFTTQSDAIVLDDICLTSTAVLPVELTSFDGRALAKSNRLTFTVASQENTELFYVERSAGPSAAWVEVAALAAAGTTSETLTYVVDDEQPLPTAYYRVRSLDYDGATQVSEVISLARSDAGNIVVYPNPVGAAFTLETDLAADTDYRLFDGLGRALLSGRVSGGFQRTEVPTANLPAGRYVLRVGDRVLRVIK